MSDPLPTVYVGPTSTKLGLTRYSHYTSLSQNVQDALKDHPALRLLLVPLDQFHDSKQTILDKSHASVNHAIEHLRAEGVI